MNKSLTSRSVEIFAPDGRFGQLYAQTDGQTMRWPNWPLSVMDAIRVVINSELRIARGLRAMGITDAEGIEQIRTVAACRFGLYNVAADFDADGRCTDIEVRTDCPVRGTCPGCGLVCSQKGISPIGEVITPSEMETSLLVAKGYSNKEIADRQGLALPSITTRMANIFSKMGITSRSQLTGWIARLGLLFTFSITFYLSDHLLP